MEEDSSFLKLSKTSYITKKKKNDVCISLYVLYFFFCRSSDGNLCCGTRNSKGKMIKTVTGKCDDRNTSTEEIKFEVTRSK